MNERPDRITKIDDLLKNTESENVPAPAERQLRNRLVEFRQRLDSEIPEEKSLWPRIFELERKTWSSGGAFAAIAILLAVMFLMRPPGADVYAWAVEALENVHTIHITGWKQEVHPGFSAVDEEWRDEEGPYAVDIWEWHDGIGQHHLYERQGPITVWDDGDRYYEYHVVSNRLYIDVGREKNLAVRFESLADDLKSINDPLTIKTTFGNKEIQGRQTVGIRFEKLHKKKKEWWFDTQTNLPLMASGFNWKDGEWEQYYELAIQYDREVPPSIVNYSPPETDDIHYASSIDPRFEEWHLRLRQLAKHYQDRPLPSECELIPRESGETFRTYTFGKMPGIEGYGVEALHSPYGDYTLRDYLRAQRVGPAGRLRLSKPIGDLLLNHDLVVKNGVDVKERVGFVLAVLGYQLAETEEEHTVWIARQDGSPRKPWREVKAPVPNPEHVPLRSGMATGRGGFTMPNLFDYFLFYMDCDLTAATPIIIDETGLPSEPPDEPANFVSNESPYWAGGDAPEMAKNWFAKEFGVTFSEEVRMVPIYVVQPKK